MKLEEAIKIAEHDNDTFQVYTVTIRNQAVKLLIEAGKRVLVERPHCWGLRHPILPGETED